MGKNKENKHCRVFINFIFAWSNYRYKGKRTLHYNLPQLWHSVGVQACHECGEHEQSYHDPEGIALGHHAVLLHLHLHPPPPPSLTLLCPHPSLSSNCPHLQAHTRLSRWSIYLSKFVILPAESISDHCLFAYLKILKLTIVGWWFYSTLCFSACFRGLKMFIYWSYFHTSMQQRIVEIAGILH